MNKHMLNETFESITPSSEQKDRMLKNILDHASSCAPAPQKVTPTKVNYRPWLGMAAGLLLVVGLSTGIHTTTPTIPPSAPIDITLSEQPQMMRQFANYNGYRYAVIPTDTLTITSDILSKPLGTLTTDLSNPETSDVNANYSSSFALGGTIWESTLYHPDYRIVIEHDGIYYLCENVGHTNDSSFDLSYFFDIANIKEHTEKIALSHSIDNEPLLILDQPDATELLTLLTDSSFVESSAVDFESLLSEASRKTSLTLTLHLEDGTSMTMYATPTQKLISIGDNYYHMSDALVTYLATLSLS